MKRIRKILVPTDLSEHSRRALSYGCGLAEDEKASLIILHVVSDLNAWELHSRISPLLDRVTRPGRSTASWPRRAST